MTTTDPRPVHLWNGGSYTGTECRTAWDKVTFPEGPDPVTTEVEDTTCRSCRNRMVAEGRCPACGEYRLAWSAGPVKLNTVADGRLTMRDVETQFYLGCNECSETLITGVTADQVLPLLNGARWRP